MITKKLTFKMATKRKENKFITSPRGPHKFAESMPLLYVVRDILSFARNAKEAKKMIKEGNVLIDQRIMKDHKYGVGLMDVITIKDKSWRVIPKKDRLILKEIDGKEANVKICKVIGKKKVKGGKIQLNLHDGRNILVDEKTEAKPMDSVLISIPDQKIVKVLKLKKGAVSLIIKGKMSGEVVNIEGMERFPTRRIWITNGEGKKEKSFDSIIVIGEGKPEINLGE